MTMKRKASEEFITWGLNMVPPNATILNHWLEELGVDIDVCRASDGLWYLISEGRVLYNGLDWEDATRKARKYASGVIADRREKI